MATIIQGKPFKCPRCGHDRIEEVMTDVTISTVIKEVHEGVEYSDNTFSTDGGEIDRYQCVECGLVVAKTEDEIMKYEP